VIETLGQISLAAASTVSPPVKAFSLCSTVGSYYTIASDVWQECCSSGLRSGSGEARDEE